MFSDFFVDDGKLNRKKRSKVGGGAQETVVSSTKPAKPTKLELKKRKLNSEIEELESELIKPKSWEYRGEVKGGDRPENSLLSVSADVERCVGDVMTFNSLSSFHLFTSCCCSGR